MFCEKCGKELADGSCYCSFCGVKLGGGSGGSEPEFRSFRRRLLIGCLVICCLGLPIGMSLGLPHVWVLSIAGIVVASIKLSRMNKSQ